MPDQKKLIVVFFRLLNFRIKKVIIKMSTVAKYQQVAIQKGGILLSTTTPKNRKLQWQCSNGHVFSLTAYKVHRRGKWCQTCGASIGERDIRGILQEFNIPFTQQCILPILPRRKYDFYFEYLGRKYLVEFDGQQHFQYVRKYHKTKAKFLESQIVDRIKTWAAWNSHCYLIRIDYSQIEYIRYHILNAVNSSNVVYLSNPELYKYITEVNITPEQLRQYIL